MKFSEENLSDIERALNEVDWSNHGYTADVEVMLIDNLAGKDVSIQFMDHKFYEGTTVVYRIGSGNFSLNYDDRFEDGDFGAVLEAAGVEDTV